MADDVGPLTNITVRIDATEDISDAWGLDKIDIVCGNSDWWEMGMGAAGFGYFAIRSVITTGTRVDVNQSSCYF